MDVTLHTSLREVPLSAVKAPPSLRNSPSGATAKQSVAGSLSITIAADDPRLLLMLLNFKCRDIYTSIMADYQSDVTVAQGVLNVMKEDFSMAKQETVVGLAKLAIELRVLVVLEKFTGPRNERRNFPDTGQVSRNSTFTVLNHETNRSKSKYFA